MKFLVVSLLVSISGIMHGCDYRYHFLPLPPADRVMTPVTCETRDNFFASSYLPYGLTAEAHKKKQEVQVAQVQNQETSAEALQQEEIVVRLAGLITRGRKRSSGCGRGTPSPVKVPQFRD